MTATEPKVDKDGRYSTKETAKMLGISRRTLDDHARIGKIKYGRRRSNGRRFYTGMEIVRYWRAEA
ncbi:MAG: helix-turn-helix domain-containing protein [Rikenellaceae bacterium]|nr:helix-turn-helix domain-containing protein [Rikenellaceae bacterium]MDE7355701.1 helix-turn-helix domain-containing protein [Rikenellaceae bacterium]